MNRCEAMFPPPDPRRCQRPDGHAGPHGHLTSIYDRFYPARAIAQYLGQSGVEVGGLALSPAALDARSASIASGQPCELVVIGQQRREDGTRRLVFGAAKTHIEATSDYRDEGRGLHYECPECGRRGGQHDRGCNLRA